MSEKKTVKLDARLHRELKVEAAKRNEQLMTLVECILREWLEKQAEEGFHSPTSMKEEGKARE